MTKKSETAQKPWDEDPKNLYPVRRIPGRECWAYATEEESERYEKYSKPVCLKRKEKHHD